MIMVIRRAACGILLLLAVLTAPLSASDPVRLPFSLLTTASMPFRVEGRSIRCWDSEISVMTSLKEAASATTGTGQSAQVFRTKMLSRLSASVAFARPRSTIEVAECQESENSIVWLYGPRYLHSLHIAGPEHRIIAKTLVDSATEAVLSPAILLPHYHATLRLPQGGTVCMASPHALVTSYQQDSFSLEYSITMTVIDAAVLDAIRQHLHNDKDVEGLTDGFMSMLKISPETRQTIRKSRRGPWTIRRFGVPGQRQSAFWCQWPESDTAMHIVIATPDTPAGTALHQEFSRLNP